MSKRALTACFTGHREIKDDLIFEKTYKVVEDLILKGYRFFGTGGARGFDTIAAEVVLKLKEQYPNIHLILVLPFDNQYKAEKGWSREEIEKYHLYKRLASKVVFESDRYEKGIYYKRNCHLVDYSSICIAYQYKNSGGTAYTTDYAKKCGVQIINII